MYVYFLISYFSSSDGDTVARYIYKYINIIMYKVRHVICYKRMLPKWNEVLKNNWFERVESFNKQSFITSFHLEGLYLLQFTWLILYTKYTEIIT